MTANKTPVDLTTNSIQTTAYEPLKKFLDLHQPVRTDDTNGNGDDVFKAANIQTIDRSYERHGYDTPDDKNIYDYHNDDVLDALLKTRAAIKGMCMSQWQQTQDVG